MAAHGTVVVAGAGLAGSRTAETLRAEGFTGRILLVGEEPLAAYERPALSKDYLAGAVSFDRLLLRPPGFYAEREIEHLTGRRVTAVDLRGRRAELDNGCELAWDALVLATGGRARRLGVPAPRGVHVLRTLADADALRAELHPGRRLAIVGGGFVGAEAASTAASLGVDVVLIDTRRPLERVVGTGVAEILTERFRVAGVQLRRSSSVVGFRSGAGGRLRALRLADGDEVACNAALLGIGAEPASELLPSLRASDGGISVDACGRTRYPDVYAAGDVASAWRPWLGARLRVEHWTSAAAQAKAVARAILGVESPDTALPYFWSDQTGLRLQYVGHAPQPARVEIDGNPQAFRADYFSHHGRLSAVLLANQPREVAAARQALVAEAALPAAA
jgi:3-phenylpropionate/trans-cinnamate dioxygenase ferredoxin reductase subunit